MLAKMMQLQSKIDRLRGGGGQNSGKGAKRAAKKGCEPSSSQKKQLKSCLRKEGEKKRVPVAAGTLKLRFKRRVEVQLHERLEAPGTKANRRIQCGSPFEKIATKLKRAAASKLNDYDSLSRSDLDQLMGPFPKGTKRPINFDDRFGCQMTCQKGCKASCRCKKLGLRCCIDAHCPCDENCANFEAINPGNREDRIRATSGFWDDMEVASDATIESLSSDEEDMGGLDIDAGMMVAAIKATTSGKSHMEEKAGDDTMTVAEILAAMHTDVVREEEREVPVVAVADLQLAHDDRFRHVSTRRRRARRADETEALADARILDTNVVGVEEREVSVVAAPDLEVSNEEIFQHVTMRKRRARRADETEALADARILEPVLDDMFVFDNVAADQMMPAEPDFDGGWEFLHVSPTKKRVFVSTDEESAGEPSPKRLSNGGIGGDKDNAVAAASASQGTMKQTVAATASVQGRGGARRSRNVAASSALNAAKNSSLRRRQAAVVRTAVKAEHCGQALYNTLAAIDGEDLQCLDRDATDKWLTDQCVFLGLVHEAAEANASGGRIAVLRPQAYREFSEGRTLSSADMGEMMYFRNQPEYIIIPLHHGDRSMQSVDGHWALAVCSIEAGTLVVYDSMPPPSKTKKARLGFIRKLMEQLLPREAFRSLEMRYSFKCHIDEQKDGWNCGMHAIIHARRFIEGRRKLKCRDNEKLSLDSERKKLQATLLAIKKAHEDIDPNVVHEAFELFGVQQHRRSPRDTSAAKLRIRQCFRRL